MPATWPSLNRWELLLCSFLPIICHFSFYVLLYLSYEKFGIVNRGRRHIKHYLAKANICVFFNVALTCIKRFETVPGSGDHDMVFPENITKRSVFQNRRNPHNSELSGRKQWYYWYYFFFPILFSQIWTNVLIKLLSMRRMDQPRSPSRPQQNSFSSFYILQFAVFAHWDFICYDFSIWKLQGFKQGHLRWKYKSLLAWISLLKFQSIFLEHLLLLSVHRAINSYMWIIFVWIHKNMPLFTHFEPFLGIH